MRERHHRWVVASCAGVLALLATVPMARAQPASDDSATLSDLDELEGLDPDDVVEIAPPAEDDEELSDLDALSDLDELEALGSSPDGSSLPGASSPPSEGFRLRSSRGFVESEFKLYLEDRSGPTKDEQWLNEIQLELDFDLTRGFNGFFRPRFLIDALDDDLLRIEPLDAYVEYRADRWDARVGQFVENWGIADTFNPVDILNRRDLGTDILDPERLGELGARVRTHFTGNDTFGEPSLALYVMPIWRDAQFPTDSNRFSFTQPPFRLADEREVSPSDEDRLFVAVRAQHTLDTPFFNADVQYVAARGPERFPFFEIDATPTGVVDLVPQYFGVWTFGGGFRAVPDAEGWSDYTLKGEVVYKRPFRFVAGAPADRPDDYVQYAAGVDRLVPTVFTDQDQLTITLEYVGENGASDVPSRFRAFDNDVVTRLFWEANDFARTSVELRLLVDVRNAELIGEAIYEQQLRAIHEDVKLQVGLQVFDPDDDEGLFSFFPNNTNLRFALRFDF